MKVSLVDMDAGEEGIIVEFSGGHGLMNRLEAIGIRSCKRLKKISSMLMRGPVVVDVENVIVALGRGMARHIIVEVMDENPYDGKS